VNHANGPLHGIKEQEWDAIRKPEEQCDAGGGSEQAVGIGYYGARVGLIHQLYVASVHLVRADDLMLAQGERVTGPPVVLLDRCQVVSHGVAQIEAVVGWGAGAAQTGKKGVDHVCPLQSLEFVPYDGVGFFAYHGAVSGQIPGALLVFWQSEAGCFCSEGEMGFALVGVLSAAHHTCWIV
jgi:hypothetical protein